MHKITQGKADVNALFVYYSWNESSFPPHSLRMTFTSNHDKNAWEGTQFEQFGDGLAAAIALSVVGDGLPMLYSGQEAGVDKRLAFFEKDPIAWKSHWVGDLYTKLFALKHENTALWNAGWGALMVKVPNNVESKVLSFVRQNDRDKVFALFNFSPQPQDVQLKEELYYGTYTDWSSGKAVEFKAPTAMAIEPWGYRVFVRAPSKP